MTRRKPIYYTTWPTTPLPRKEGLRWRWEIVEDGVDTLAAGGAWTMRGALRRRERHIRRLEPVSVGEAAADA